MRFKISGYSSIVYAGSNVELPNHMILSTNFIPRFWKRVNRFALRAVHCRAYALFVTQKIAAGRWLVKIFSDLY